MSTQTHTIGVSHKLATASSASLSVVRIHEVTLPYSPVTVAGQCAREIGMPQQSATSTLRRHDAPEAATASNDAVPSLHPSDTGNSSQSLMIYYSSPMAAVRLALHEHGHSSFTPAKSANLTDR